MKLATKRRLLRPVCMADLPHYFELDADPEVAAPIGLSGPASLVGVRKSIRQAMRDWKKPGINKMAFTIMSRSGREWLGGINLRWPHGGVGELGYAIAPRHQGNGYAAEAVKKVIDVAFQSFGAHRVQATCWVRNRPSARVLRKAGLRKEGTLRGYLRQGRKVRDEFIFGITRADWKKSRLNSKKG
ncbi:MAG: GNAT family N-acetyltransferase [Elusimicrobia bacterium]|nr:GNAT family N-acetyltransferase [Elusimicrobiota bacterium]